MIVNYIYIYMWKDSAVQYFKFQWILTNKWFLMTSYVYNIYNSINIGNTPMSNTQLHVLIQIDLIAVVIIWVLYSCSWSKLEYYLSYNECSAVHGIFGSMSAK